MSQKFSDEVIECLLELGYTHCFFLAGGNIMHLLDSVRTRMVCVPFVHEVSAGIAAEYFNASQSNEKAFVLVTAGPGVSNITTAIAGAWLESRDLLVLGGQVKTSDLATGEIRQRGIQEIDGPRLLESITKKSVRLDFPINKESLSNLVAYGYSGRKGPIFIEVPLDIQASNPQGCKPLELTPFVGMPSSFAQDLEGVFDALKSSKRAVLLVGGGISQSQMRKILPACEALRIPIMTTWNGADRVNADYPFYFGRPNTWGQRYSNIIIQQADLIIAIGTRLGLQQTGFNTSGFAPLAKLIQVDIDKSELYKEKPRVDFPIHGDAEYFLRLILVDNCFLAIDDEWLDFCEFVKSNVPVIEYNESSSEFLSTYRFWNTIASMFGKDAIFIPSSSGGTFTSAYQAIDLRGRQKILSNKSLASMGYGLPGAIGAAFANQETTIILGEGDGGFAQNLQELGTVARNNLNIKMFVMDNDGYASIRMTQQNYFDGAWVGCDSSTGVGLPNLELLAQTYGIPFMEMSSDNFTSEAIVQKINAPGPLLIQVAVDPKQTFYPKISSRIIDSGSMESNPLHLMTPELPRTLADKVFKYLKMED
jgi:acetolactate synthase-1/2/3 large subunit